MLTLTICLFGVHVPDLAYDAAYPGCSCSLHGRQTTTNEDKRRQTKTKRTNEDKRRQTRQTRQTETNVNILRGCFPLCKSECNIYIILNVFFYPSAKISVWLRQTKTNEDKRRQTKTNGDTRRQTKTDEDKRRQSLEVPGLLSRFLIWCPTITALNGTHEKWRLAANRQFTL